MNIDKSQDSIAKIAIFFRSIILRWLLRPTGILYAYFTISYTETRIWPKKKNVSGFKGYDIRGLLEKFADKFVRLWAGYLHDTSETYQINWRNF